MDDLLILLVLLVSSRSALVNFADAFQIAVLALALGVWLLRGGGLAVAFLGFCLASLLWLSLHAFLDNAVSARTWAGHFLRPFTAALVVGCVSRPLDRLAAWVVRLAVLSLVLFPLGLILPGLIERLHALTPEALRFVGGTMVGETLTGSWRRASWLVYTFSPDRPHQNHGFMWEPAAFGMVLALGLWARILSGRYRFDRANLVLLAAMLSTFSTTAWLGAMASAGFMLWRHGGGARLALVYLLPVLALAGVTLEFLAPKIAAEFSAGYRPQMQWSLSRMASFELDMAELAEAPLLGQGIVTEARAPRLPSNNGLSDFLVRYGLLMSLGALALLLASLHRLYRPGPGAMAAFLLTLTIFGWAEKFLELPLFYLWLFAGFSAVPSPAAASAEPARAY
ncbi:MAG: hypothetical protein D6811_12680 [Alphaproteobacteria bacterium]|nr:MAG: hypothetical protein D6811_12680 [Alphaproteobacteria bacterium]